MATPSPGPHPAPSTDAASGGAPAGAPPRVVVGVDGSACGAKALDWALHQAVLLGASVDAVASWQTPAMTSAGYGAFVDVASFDLADPTREMLEKSVAAGLGEVPGAQDLEVRYHVGQGYAARVLLEAAEGADLLVVGSRGHGELGGMLLGSVGLHCVTHAPCPVVVVRSAPSAKASHA